MLVEAGCGSRTIFKTVGFDDILCLVDDVGHINLEDQDMSTLHH
jgi:hypothetical protein